MPHRDTALLQVLQMVAVAANEARDVSSAAQTCLNEVCRVTGWPIGHLYLTRADGLSLEPSGVWHASLPIGPFRDLTNTLSFNIGVGLPGRVFASREPHWIIDVTRDSNFPRAAVAAASGLRSAVAFPVLVGSDVVGVLEFFSNEVIEPDQELLGALAQVGGQLGRVVERIRAADALQESELRFRSVAQSAVDAIVVANQAAEVVFWNAAAEKMFGRRERGMLGQPLTIIMPERFRAAHAAGITRVGAGGPSKVLGQTVELVGLRYDGSEFPLELSLSTWRIRGDMFFSGIIRDLSERRATEEAAKETDARLRHAVKMEAIGRLAGGIAHDFNNMLTAILGFSDLLLEQVAEQPIGRDLMEIKRVAERAAELTRGLLAFSRKQAMRIEVLDLNDLVRAMDLMCRRIIGEDVNLVVSLSSSTGQISADRSQVEQIIMNLVVNARDAMPDGGTLMIETLLRDVDAVAASRRPPLTPGQYMVLMISDTGVGMTDEVKQRLFEPFFTTKEPEKGTGLGLATSYGVVKQLGGFIWADSELNKGSRFTIYLPTTARPVETPSEQAKPATAAGRGTILVVEDEEAVRRFTTVCLQRHGYTVVEAAGADEALAWLANWEGPLDLLLTDVVMPGLQGPDLADRARPQRPDLRVLFMTGYVGHAIAQHGVLNHLNLLEKPFTSTALLSRVGEMLEQCDQGLSDLGRT